MDVRHLSDAHLGEGHFVALRLAQTLVDELAQLGDDLRVCLRHKCLAVLELRARGRVSRVSSELGRA